METICLHSMTNAAVKTSCEDAALAVDLDASLVLTDTLHESAVLLLRNSPLQVLRLPLWLMQGKAALKEKLAQMVQLNPALLPYNEALLDWLRIQKAQGRRLVLCTATNRTIAQSIANHLGIFAQVFASDGKTNLAGTNKKHTLEEHFGKQGFDYVGNSKTDLDVWSGARKAILVNVSPGIARQAEQLTVIERTFESPPVTLSTWSGVFRVHQWLKNLLLFVPLLAAHQVSNIPLLSLLGLAFAAFSLCASSVYITNDLLDLESDRRHSRKRHRPFASGLVPVAYGALLAPVCALLGMAIAVSVGNAFATWLIIYYTLTLAYSFWLKRQVLLDCLTLAALYTLRIVAGATAVDIPLSFWLLAFSVFMFLSLAFMKRYSELQLQAADGNLQAYGRGYFVTDAPFIQTLGIAAGYAAVLVLALYLHGETVVKLYQRPEFIWASVPMVLFWVSWIWIKAHRGLMDDDPIVFGMKDKTSLLIGALVVATFVLATLWER